MDIKTPQLKNNQTNSVTDTSATRIPAKTSETGMSFVEELATLPEIKTTELPMQNNADNNIQKNSEPQKETSTENKNFEFVSTSNDFQISLKNETQKETSSENKICEFISTSNDFQISLKNETQKEKQFLHKNAEKELVNEIVLMNQQDFSNKKTEIKVAEQSNIKNNTKLDKKSEEKIVKKDNIKQEIQNQQIQPEISTILAPETDINCEKISVPTNNAKVETVENKTLNKNIVTNETIKTTDKVSEKNNAKISKTKDIEKIEILDKKQHLETPQKEPINKVKNENFIKENQVIEKTPSFKNNIETTKKDVFEQKDTAKLSQEIQPIKKTSEAIINEVKTVKPETNNLKNDIEINLNKNLEQVSMPQKNNILKDNPEIQKVVSNSTDKSAGKTLKTKDSKNIINSKKFEKSDIKKLSEVIDKLTEKPEIKVSQVTEAKVKTDNMPVIKFEPIISSPISELDKNLITSKTSDIVKFLDANLSTKTTTKTQKSSSSKAIEKPSEKSIKMTEADAKFFNNLIETNQQVIEGTKTADSTMNLKDVQATQSVQVSKSLLNALKESQENNKSFRVDFDKDLSVILRVNKNGQISAEFLPGDKAVEQYLKANLPLLQQQFKNEGLEYENLSYRQSKKDDEDKQKQQHRENKKENGYE